MNSLAELKRTAGDMTIAHVNDLQDAVQFMAQSDTLVNFRLHLDNAIDAAQGLFDELVRVRDEAKNLMEH